MRIRSASTSPSNRSPIVAVVRVRRAIHPSTASSASATAASDTSGVIGTRRLNESATSAATPTVRVARVEGDPVSRPQPVSAVVGEREGQRRIGRHRAGDTDRPAGGLRLAPLRPTVARARRSAAPGRSRGHGDGLNRSPRATVPGNVCRRRWRRGAEVPLDIASSAVIPGPLRNGLGSELTPTMTPRRANPSPPPPGWHP